MGAFRWQACTTFQLHVASEAHTTNAFQPRRLALQIAFVSASASSCLRSYTGCHRSTVSALESLPSIPLPFKKPQHQFQNCHERGNTNPTDSVLKVVAPGPLNRHNVGRCAPRVEPLADFREACHRLYLVPGKSGSSLGTQTRLSGFFGGLFGGASVIHVLSASFRPGQSQTYRTNG